MNTYGLSKGDARGLPTRIPTQNNRFTKLACSLAYNHSHSRSHVFTVSFNFNCRILATYFPPHWIMKLSSTLKLGTWHLYSEFWTCFLKPTHNWTYTDIFKTLPWYCIQTKGESYEDGEAYGQSKLANVLFVREVAAREEAAKSGTVELLMESVLIL